MGSRKIMVYLTGTRILLKPVPSIHSPGKVKIKSNYHSPQHAQLSGASGCRASRCQEHAHVCEKNAWVAHDGHPPSDLLHAGPLTTRVSHPSMVTN